MLTERGRPVAGVAVLLSIGCLAPFVLLAPFNRPIVDDFLFAKMRAVLGYWPAQWIYYTTIYGRYTALAVISLNPMTFGPRYIWFLQITPFVIMGLLFVSMVFLARSLPAM